MADTPVKKAWDLVDEAKASIDNLSAAELKAAMGADGTVVVDIRDHRELYLKGKIPGAVHAPRGMLEFWVDPASEYYREVFKPEQRYLLYCAGGGRSALAAKTMKDMGYGNVGHLEPGFGGWEAAGYEIEDIKATSKWVPREG
ncbi:MAG: rhodanese-like domain-containing protein [Actinomycetota bacterium]